MLILPPLQTVRGRDQGRRERVRLRLFTIRLEHFVVYGGREGGREGERRGREGGRERREREGEREEREGGRERDQLFFHIPETAGGQQ